MKTQKCKKKNIYFVQYTYFLVLLMKLKKKKPFVKGIINFFQKCLKLSENRTLVTFLIILDPHKALNNKRQRKRDNITVYEKG